MSDHLDIKAFPRPSRDELAENDVAITITSPLDDLGRAHFTAFWLEDYLTPDGVRGQVFHTSIADFLRSEDRQGIRVTALDEHTRKILGSIAGESQEGTDA